MILKRIKGVHELGWEAAASSFSFMNSYKLEFPSIINVGNKPPLAAPVTLSLIESPYIFLSYYRCLYYLFYYYFENMIVTTSTLGSYYLKQ